MRARILSAAVIVAAIMWALPASAALVGRDLDGNSSTIEAYYDTALDITWLADANFALTNGDDSDGLMNWADATLWVSNLVVGTATAWRLPTVTDTGAAGCDWSYSGTDCGYNGDTSASEMAHMFYVTLGNLAEVDAFGNPQIGGLTNTYPFTNLQSSGYWTGTQAWPPAYDGAWSFIGSSGYQVPWWKGLEFSAWAVHDGSVGTPVPLPAAAWLFMSAVAGLLVVGRRRPGKGDSPLF